MQSDSSCYFHQTCVDWIILSYFQTPRTYCCIGNANAVGLLLMDNIGVIINNSQVTAHSIPTAEISLNGQWP